VQGKGIRPTKCLDLLGEIEIDVTGMFYPDSDEGKSEKSERGWREENA